jgi:hypothetical protein
MRRLHHHVRANTALLLQRTHACPSKLIPQLRPAWHPAIGPDGSVRGYESELVAASAAVKCASHFRRDRPAEPHFVCI